MKINNDPIKWERADEDYVISCYRELHQIPETGLFLPQTKAYIEKKLQEMGLTPVHYEGHSSVSAKICGRDESRVILLRADMDGLEMAEETGLPYASANGNMHSCGHDAHMAMLLGAARILMRYRQRMKGCVRLLFQAGEEEPGGAVLLLGQGILEGPVEAVFGQHAGNLAGLPKGNIGVKSGPVMAAKDSFSITIHGKGCHGAMPEQGIDPVVTATQIILALQTLISRERRGTEPAVLTVGSVHGGAADNIISDSVVMRGALRTTDSKFRAYMEERIVTICTKTAEAMRAGCDIHYSRGYPVLENDPACTTFFREQAQRFWGKEQVSELESAILASDDMACYLEQCPGVYWFYQTIEPESPYGNHHPGFVTDETLLMKGAAFLAHLSMEWFLKKEDGNCLQK